MKVFLFGGAGRLQNQVPIQLKLIASIIKELKLDNLVFIPYARTNNDELIIDSYNLLQDYLPNVDIIDARIVKDFSRFDNYFLQGGNSQDNLYKSIISNGNLESSITNAKFICGESAGAMILCSKYRSDNREIVDGLNIIKNTFIEPHYSERNRKKFLNKIKEKYNITNCIGIDCVTGIEINLSSPSAYKRKFGEGNIVIL